MTKNSYSQIFRSAAYTGGASIINIVLGVVRTKTMAVLLGPTGIGLAGVYTSIASLATVVAGLGLNSSGVRQIAEASSSGDQERIGRTIQALRRTAAFLGILGGCCLVAFSSWIARVTFGDDSRALSVALLGIVIAISVISSGQMALIQGLRRIADLAKLNVLGALAGTVIGLPLIWILRERGIVPLLIVVPTASLLFSWWFARRVPVSPVRLTIRQTFEESRALLSLGVTFMISALLTAAVAYVTRLLILRYLGLSAAGQYTAAYTLSGIYAGFILQAMGADFYPRLTAVSKDHQQMNSLVNEQAEVALLVALPGALATLTFAPLVIKAFYAADFQPAVIVLQWHVLGILGRVISWPLGFILLAKGRATLFLISEIFAAIVHVALVFAFVPRLGLVGAGVAFASLYVCYTLLVLAFSKYLTDFFWNPLNRRILLSGFVFIAVVFSLSTHPSSAGSIIISSCLTVLVGLVCLKMLLRRMPAHRLGRFARWVS